MYAQRTSRVPSRAEVARMTAVSSSELALPTPMQSFPERPKPASRLAPKRPDGEPSPFLFRFYEAAVRDLTHSAMTGRWRSAQNFSSQTALDDWFRAANLNSALTCPGQFRSYDWPENRHASDRFQSAAATGRRTVDGAYSPKRSRLRPRSASGAGRTSAVQSAAQVRHGQAQQVGEHRPQQLAGSLRGEGQRQPQAEEAVERPHAA